REQLAQALPVSFSLEGDGVQSDDAIEGWFRFETAVARGTGHLRLRGGRCWTLLTAMEELKGFEEPAGRRRPEGIEHRAMKVRQTWTDEQEERRRTLGVEVQPYCLIVGGSQGGLALAARLKRLN